MPCCCRGRSGLSLAAASAIASDRSCKRVDDTLFGMDRGVADVCHGVTLRRRCCVGLLWISPTVVINLYGSTKNYRLTLPGKPPLPRLLADTESDTDSESISVTPTVT